MDNKLGTYEQVTIDYVVSGCKMRLGIKDSSEDDLFLADSVNRGLKRLRNLGMFIPAVTTVQINDNHTAKLPLGFIRFNQPYPIVFVDAEGQLIQNGWYQVPRYINNTFYTDSPISATQQYTTGGTVNQVNGYLFFSSDITARFAKIEFLTSNVDDNGELVVPAIAEDTLGAFGCREYGLAFPDKVSQTSLRIWDKEWKAGKKMLKGIFNGSQGIDQPYITYKMKSLV